MSPGLINKVSLFTAIGIGTIIPGIEALRLINNSPIRSNKSSKIKDLDSLREEISNIGEPTKKQQVEPNKQKAI